MPQKRLSVISVMLAYLGRDEEGVPAVFLDISINGFGRLLTYGLVVPVLSRSYVLLRCLIL